MATGDWIALAGFVALFAMIALRVPIGVAMGLVGVFGFASIRGINPALNLLATSPIRVIADFNLSLVPFFILMGIFATNSGMSRELFRAGNAWLGSFRGGLALSTIAACAGFAAICGSTVATAATMTKIALPEMRRENYPDHVATGVIAAGGTLGILIPPSVVLVIYAILTEQNIIKLFMAAMVPGVLAALGYMITIAIYVRVKPDSAGQRDPAGRDERLTALIQVWPVLVIFALVIGGIYLGWFTPTEGAAVGAAGTGLVALFNGRLTWRGLGECITGTAISTGMIFFIVLGAAVYNGFLAFSQLPQEAANTVATLGISPWLVLLAILACYLIFGCVMDSLSMILLTIPIFFPIVSALDFGLPAEEMALWFGVIVLIVVEVGLITPPVGMNLFVINSMAPDVPLARTYGGALPFVLSDVIRVAILILFPGITLGLVRLLY